jgi:hypothetical protein
MCDGEIGVLLKCIVDVLSRYIESLEREVRACRQAKKIRVARKTLEPLIASASCTDGVAGAQ